MAIDLETVKVLIQKSAMQLFCRLIITRGNDTPPFLSEEYARLLEIKRVEKEDLGETSGVLIRLREGSIIKVNQNHNRARQNFSCAHEIGHILFSQLKLEEFFNTIENRTFNPQAKVKARSVARERLCDIAATKLLMPESIFIKYLSGIGISIYSIEQMAKIFQVSIRAAARRVAEVSIEPCIAIIWHLVKKTEDIRIVGCVGPGSTSTGKSNYIPKKAVIKDKSSILHKAYKQDRLVKSYRDFLFGKERKRLSLKLKGFGYGENRSVISLAYPER